MNFCCDFQITMHLSNGRCFLLRWWMMKKLSDLKKLSERKAEILCTLAIAAAGWAFKVERNTARTATATEFIQKSYDHLEKKVEDNSGLGTRNSQRLDDHDRRLDEHQSQLDKIKGGL